jgi:HNH/Endo VII superfamily toxin with a SHH signature
MNVGFHASTQPTRRAIALVEGFKKLYTNQGGNGNKDTVPLTMREWKKGIQQGFSVTDVTLLGRHGFNETSGIWKRPYQGGELKASKNNQGIWKVEVNTSQANKIVEEYTLKAYNKGANSKGTAGFFQDHHIVQEQWAIERIGKGLPSDGKYSKDKAIAITLRDSLADSPHRIITDRQTRRKSGIVNRTYMEERSLAMQDLIEAKVPEEAILEALQQNDTYFKEIWQNMTPAQRDPIFGDVSGLNW